MATAARRRGWVQSTGPPTSSSRNWGTREDLPLRGRGATGKKMSRQCGRAGGRAGAAGGPRAAYPRAAKRGTRLTIRCFPTRLSLCSRRQRPRAAVATYRPAGLGPWRLQPSPSSCTCPIGKCPLASGQQGDEMLVIGARSVTAALCASGRRHRARDVLEFHREGSGKIFESLVLQ